MAEAYDAVSLRVNRRPPSAGPAGVCRDRPLGV